MSKKNKKISKPVIKPEQVRRAGGRLTIAPKPAVRTTLDRRKAKIEQRNHMKVIVDGEEKEVPEASRYFIDMTIPSEDNE